MGSRGLRKRTGGGMSGLVKITLDCTVYRVIDYMMVNLVWQKGPSALDPVVCAARSNAMVLVQYWTQNYNASLKLIRP